MDDFKCLLAAVVLMTGRGVLDKSPDYITEKFWRYIGYRNSPHPGGWQWGLDMTNRGIFDEYCEKWKVGES